MRSRVWNLAEVVSPTKEATGKALPAPPKLRSGNNCPGLAIEQKVVVGNRYAARGSGRGVTAACWIKGSESGEQSHATMIEPESCTDER